LIVVGISPGLRSLAYCVLGFSKDTRRPEIRDSDLLKGGKPKEGALEAEIRGKAKPHALVLDVVLERAHDENSRQGISTVVAVGPAIPTTREPAAHGLTVRLVLRGIVYQLKNSGWDIEYMEWRTLAELDAALGVRHGKAVRSTLNNIGRAHLKNKAFMLAAASSIAGQRALETRLLPPVVAPVIPLRARRA
jgi:hypothetical protein